MGVQNGLFGALCKVLAPHSEGLLSNGAYICIFKPQVILAQIYESQSGLVALKLCFRNECIAKNNLSQELFVNAFG